MLELHGLLSDKLRDRYSRQILLDQIGDEGQEKLMKAKVVIIGCGATGSHLANIMVRAGAGNIKIIDRDFVELNNLQRQNLYDENDIEQPKAIAAMNKLKLVNSDISIEAEVADLNPSNAEELVKDADLILDGTDNMSTRFIINDISVKLGIPWIYSGAVSTYGMTMNILHGEDAPCFRCFLPQPPRPGSLQTCDTVGVLNTVPQLITGFAGTEAIKLLMGMNVKPGRLIISDIWDADIKVVDIEKRDSCKSCIEKDFEFLSEDQSNVCVSLCGRNAVQVRPAEFSGQVNFNSIKDRLEKSGQVRITDYILIFHTGDIKITLFKDGRSIIQGVADENEAISVFAKYIGL